MAPALETLFLQQARALNDYRDLGYRLHYWRTAAGDEVDFVLYGERGLRAFEVKMAHNVRPDDLRGLLRFRADFPQAKAHLLYLGNRRWHDRGVEVLPFADCVPNSTSGCDRALSSKGPDQPVNHHCLLRSRSRQGRCRGLGRGGHIRQDPRVLPLAEGVSQKPTGWFDVSKVEGYFHGSPGELHAWRVGAGRGRQRTSTTRRETPGVRASLPSHVNRIASSASARATYTAS